MNKQQIAEIGIDILDFDFKNPPKPYFVDNDRGISWWLEKGLTEYALQKGCDFTVWITRSKNGYYTRIVVENGGPIYEGTALESVACFIDVEAANRQFGKKSKKKA